MYELELDEGKYKIIYNENPHQFKALRYGEEWRNLTGDGLILSLVFKVMELEDKLQIKV